MPGRVKVRILNARDLPIMDRASELTDAFVEVRFGPDTYKTEVCKKSLNPQWNSEWFKFEVDDEDLQDEPLDLKVLDYDTYSSHDTIGKVYIDLNPLLSRDSPNTISGWFPIYDTMHGLRGELNVQVRVDLFNDFNKFRQSSCGIQLFCSCQVPSGWRIQAMLGFIEELVVNDDPEHQWIEKIRTPRASNEARQRIFSKLSGTLQRKLGVKVLEMGGNAVLGYFQNFDLEGESGIVVRAIGTAVSLTRVQQVGQPSPAGLPSSMSPGKDPTLPCSDGSIPACPAASKAGNNSPHNAMANVTTPTSESSSPTVQQQQQQRQHHRASACQPSPEPTSPETTTPSTMIPGTTTPVAVSSDIATENPSSVTPVLAQQDQATSCHVNHDNRGSTPPVRVTPEPEARTRKYSESDVCSPPRASTVGQVGTPLNTGTAARVNLSKTAMFQQSIDLLEYPFFTMRSFPSGFIVNLGGVVSARSVKLLDKIHNPEEPQTRDAWWSELRVEIKSHALKLGCHAVLGYTESTTICEEVIVLSASGTAAKIDFGQDFAANVNTANHNMTGVTGGSATSNASSTSPVGGANNSTVTQTGDKVNAPVVGGGKDAKEKHLFVDIGLANHGLQKTLGSVDLLEEVTKLNCDLCHIPYCPSNMPFEIHLSKCAICRTSSVPEVLFMTIDPPFDMPIWSKGCLVQARICRGRNNKNKSSEQLAREVSDILPFIEYEVHNQLINKLKLRGLNCLFGLNIQVALGDNMIVAVATATGAFLGPLPPSPQPSISTEVATEHESQDLAALRKRITRTVHMHRERLNSEILERQGDYSPLSRPPTDDESDDDDDKDEGNFIVEKTKDRNTFVLVIDDVKDESVSLMLHDVIPPEGFDIVNTQTPPGISPDKFNGNLQMFSQIVKVMYQPHVHNSLDFSAIFNSILRRLCFKLRHLRPCCIADISFQVDLPDEDEINISVTGCCLGLQDSSAEAPSTGATLPTSNTFSSNRFVHAQHSKSLESQPSTASLHQTHQGDELLFPLDGVGDQAFDPSPPSHAYRQGSVTSQVSKASVFQRQSKVVSAHRPKPGRGIELTPLNKIYNGRIERYLGYYNFFFIRESTSVKECGGIGGFLQSFILEVKAIVRAHVLALGGNGLVAYNMSQFVLDDNPHKNQGQCLINVSGDVAVIDYDDDEKTSTFIDTPVWLPQT